MADPKKSLISSSPNPGSVVAGIYDSIPPAPADGQAVALQTDSQGNLLVNVVSGGGSNNSVAATNASAPAFATEVGTIDSSGKLQGVSNSNPVPIKAGTLAEVTASWNSSTALNTALSLNVAGYSTVAFSFSGVTLNNGAVTFEVSDTTNFTVAYPIPAIPLQSLTAGGGTGAGVPQTTFSFNAALPNTIWVANVSGWAAFRIRLSTVLSSTNTAAVTLAAQEVIPYFQYVSGQVSAQSSNAPLGDGQPNGQQTAANSGNIGFAYATFPEIFNGATWDRLRTPAVFKTAKATSTGTTAVWTPTSGKKFRLMRFKIMVSANASQTTGGVVDFDLQDSATSINVIHSVFIPSASGTTMAGWYDSGWVDLGNGYLSTTANNVLNLVFSAAGFPNTAAVRVIAVGTEE